MDACLVLLMQDAIMLTSGFCFILHASFLALVSNHLFTLDEYFLMLFYEFQLFALWLLSQYCQLLVIQGKKLIFQYDEIHLLPEFQFATVTVLLKVYVGHEVVEKPKIAMI